MTTFSDVVDAVDGLSVDEQKMLVVLSGGGLPDEIERLCSEMPPRSKPAKQTHHR